MPRARLIQPRAGTAAAWAAADAAGRLLALNEIGYITDTDVFVMGDGVTATLALPAVGLGTGNVSTPLTSGIANQLRETGTASTNGVTSGVLHLQYFQPPRALTVAALAYYSGATAAGATPSFIKYGLFSVAANGDLTRIGITASNTALFVAANTRYSENLLAAAAITPGTTYASGMLLITAAATPTLVAALQRVTGGALAAAVAPRLNGQIAAQTDILASYTAAQVATSLFHHYAELTP